MKTIQQKLDEIMEFSMLDDSIGVLTEREDEFIPSVQRQYDAGQTLSQKQLDWIDSIYDKVCDTPI